MYIQFIKKSLDYSFALLLLFLSMPLLACISVLLLFHFRKNPFFTQKRIGHKEKPFTILKFRTMVDVEKGIGLADEQRITVIGKWLRQTRWDELPQLLNILKGDMSFIGPRPLLPEYLSLYPSPVKEVRHNVKPGLTGLAQINGAANLEWDRRFLLDLHYVQNLSFVLDCKIVIGTIPFLFFIKGDEKNIGKYQHTP